MMELALLLVIISFCFSSCKSCKYCFLSAFFWALATYKVFAPNNKIRLTLLSKNAWPIRSYLLNEMHGSNITKSHPIHGLFCFLGTFWVFETKKPKTLGCPIISIHYLHTSYLTMLRKLQFNEFFCHVVIYILHIQVSVLVIIIGGSFALLNEMSNKPTQDSSL